MEMFIAFYLNYKGIDVSQYDGKHLSDVWAELQKKWRRLLTKTSSEIRGRR